MAAPPASPELNELRGFCVAADLGSLGRAAVRLRVSQPSLSKRLASLETKVGARLLERSARGVTLTGAGRRLYRHARPLLEAADQVAEVMAGIRQTGAVVRLAASHSASEAFVAALLTDLNAHTAARGRAGDRQLAGRARAGGRRARGRRRRRLAAQPHPQPRRARDQARGRRDRLRGAARPPLGRAREGEPPRFLATPMVVRDPSSNARWTVDAVLAADDLRAAAPLVEAATPRAAIAEARKPPRARAPQPPRDRPDRLHPRCGRGPGLPAQLRARVPPTYGEATARCASSSSASASTSGSGCASRCPPWRRSTASPRRSRSGWAGAPRAGRRGGAPRSGRDRFSVSEPVRGLDGGVAPVAGEGVDRGADARVLVADAGRGLAPVGVGLRQRGQDEPLLDLEVPASARMPEGLQVSDGRSEVPSPARRSRSAASSAW